MSWKEAYDCPECGLDFEITFTPSTPNKYMNGRMEDAEQGSGAECSPSRCPECDSEIDAERLEEDLAPDPDDYPEPDFE
jgi:ssDNA-binding Zn-finger/Zn-ribbon topoisomerase 1